VLFIREGKILDDEKVGEDIREVSGKGTENK
jgi:hypothetical protein